MGRHISKLIEPCKEFELVSTGPAKQFRSETMGTCIKEDRLFNGRILYHNKNKGRYLYWMNEAKGNWIVILLFVVLYKFGPVSHLLTGPRLSLFFTWRQTHIPQTALALRGYGGLG